MNVTSYPTLVEEGGEAMRLGGAQGAGGEAAIRRYARRPGGLDLPEGDAGEKDSPPGTQEKEGGGGRQGGRQRGGEG